MVPSSTAVLSRLANMVVALECDRGLAQRTADALTNLGIDNAVVVEGLLERGWAAQAPYNVILLGGAAARIPEAVLNQLTEGGRLAGVETRGGIGRAMLYLRHRGVISGRPRPLPCCFNRRSRWASSSAQNVSLPMSMR